MPLTQHLEIIWDKSCRGAPYSSLRNEMDKCCILPKLFYDYNTIGYPAHYVFYKQLVKGIEEFTNRVDRLTEIEN